MGILNITPDSFSDGGRYLNLDQALFRTEQMITEGAAVIDIGGESTRPGALPVADQLELDRVIPVIEALRARFDTILSVDTRKPIVMQAAIAAGIHIINDINALQAEGALAIVANSQVAVCLMHMSGEPQTMQINPQYQNISLEVTEFLQQRINFCLAAGITKERIIIDPGFGFGKTMQHNLQLFKQLPTLQSLGYPILVGLSRKAMLGKILQTEDISQRLIGSLTLAALAVFQGAKLIRVHDVRATVDAIKTVTAVLQSSAAGEVL